MTTKMNAVRFLFIDEIEAAGADTIGTLEPNSYSHVATKNPYKFRADGSSRPFGGLNVFFLGDFWQLSPTGQIAIMSDVTAAKVIESARARFIMSIFWDRDHPDTLQAWHGSERVLHLTTNIRSEFSGLLSPRSFGRRRLQLPARIPD